MPGAPALLLYVSGWISALALLAAPRIASAQGAGPPTGPADACAPAEHWPGDAWTRASPRELRFDEGRLAAAERAIRSEFPLVRSFLVVRGGRLVVERYFGSAHPDSLAELASVTKSVTSALVGIAVADGELAADLGPVVRHVPDAAPSSTEDPARRVTLLHLLSMTGGLAGGAGGVEVPFRALREPGSRWEYSDGGANLLSVILGIEVGGTLEYARTRLFEPIGVRRTRWASNGFGTGYGAGGLEMRPADLARFGLLYLRGGCWAGKRIVPDAWVRRSAAPGSPGPEGPDGYGLLWWTGRFDGDDGYYAAGYGGQFLVVVPARDLVVVLTANPGDGTVQFGRYLGLIRERVVPAAR